MGGEGGGAFQESEFLEFHYDESYGIPDPDVLNRHKHDLVRSFFVIIH